MINSTEPIRAVTTNSLFLCVTLLLLTCGVLSAQNQDLSH